MISEETCEAVLSALSTCKHLTELYLTDIAVNGVGVHMAQLIQAWGPKHQLQRLDLDGCQMPEEACAVVLKALSILKQLKELWLDRNTVGAGGVQLADSIQAWGPEPPLVHMDGCEMSDKVWAVVLTVLSSCKQLGWIYLSHNKLTGCLHSLTPGKVNMTRLHLINTSLTAADVKHLKCLVRSGFWFDNLHLSDNDLGPAEAEVRQLLQFCCMKAPSEGNSRMNVYLRNTNMSQQFHEEMDTMCKGSDVMIDWLNEVPDDVALHT